MANPKINGDMWDAYGKRWGNLEIFTILSTIASSSEKMIPVDFQIWMVGKLETTKQGGFDGQSRSEKNKSKASTRICIPGGMWSVTMPEPPAMYKVHLTGWSGPASRHGHQEQIGI